MNLTFTFSCYIVAVRSVVLTQCYRNIWALLFWHWTYDSKLFSRLHTSQQSPI